MEDIQLSEAVIEAKIKLYTVDKLKSELEIEETDKRKLEAEAIAQKDDGAINFSRKYKAEIKAKEKGKLKAEA